MCDPLRRLTWFWNGSAVANWVVTCTCVCMHVCVCACALTVYACNTYTDLHCCEVCGCELCSVVTVMTSCPLSPVADEIVQQICEAVALLFSNDSSYEFCLDGLMVRVFTWSVFQFECSVYALGEQLVLILNSYFSWGSLYTIIYSCTVEGVKYFALH